MLTVISGPMFSGKTSKLISIANANLIAGKKIMVFKPSNDLRYARNHVVTHAGEKIQAELISQKSPDTIMYEYPPKIDDDAVLFFDECQFFYRESFEHLIRKLLGQGREVVCAGLPNDFSGWPFGPMPTLLAMADEIISLKSVCSKCKKIASATRTFRKTKDMEQTVVGGADIYEARCFDCWKEVLNEEVSI